MATKDNKVELKKQNSYTYWVDNNPKFFKDAPPPDIKPQEVKDTSKIKYHYSNLKKQERTITITYQNGIAVEPGSKRHSPQ